MDGLEGLALARSGAARRANELLRALHRGGDRDPESLATLARTHKDLAADTPSSTQRREHLERAASLYEEAFHTWDRRLDSPGGEYPGINAATLHSLLGHQDRATELVAAVRALCADPAPETDPFWRHATLAEAALVVNEVERAETEYRRTATLGRGRHADISVARRQARLLAAARDLDDEWADRVLPVPPIIVFTGHLSDLPDRPRPRFPSTLETPVREEIRSRLSHLRPAAGYSSAACGSDTIFLEELIALGAEAHIVLPYSVDEFREDSVAIAPGTWGERFDAILAAADEVIQTSDHRATDSESTFQYANLVLTGVAELRRRALETALVPMAVWDGRPAENTSGTAWIVHHWLSRGYRVEHVDLVSLARRHGGPSSNSISTPAGGPASEEPPTFAHEIKSYLFADAVDFSRLTGDQIPLFAEHFLGAIAELIDAAEGQPLLQETAGDGLYLVFETPSEAGRFALALSRRINDTAWADLGLPESLNLRISLHSGPSYSFIDPVTRRRNYTGPHVSRAARIEPITPPGQVYGSQAFACLALATGSDELAFEYVGVTALAKAYGSMPLFHVTGATPRHQ